MDPPTQLHASHSNSELADFFFFSQDEIFDGDICKIDPKTISTTVYIKPWEYDKFNNDLKLRYGDPVDKGKHGLIFRGYILDSSVMEQVVITSYPSTCTLNIQGRGHATWVSIILKDIIKNLSLPNQPDSSDINFSLGYDEEFPPLLQSTPHRVQETVKYQPTSSSVQPQTESELNSSSDSKQVQELTAQLALYKEMNTNLQRQIIQLQQALRSRTSTSSNLIEEPCVTSSSQMRLKLCWLKNALRTCLPLPKKQSHHKS